MTDKTDDTVDTNEDTSGLKAKNADLLNKLKTANAKSTDLEKRLNDLEAAQSDALDSTKSEAERDKAKLERQIKSLTDANAKNETRLSALLIDNTINDAVAKAGVLPHFIPAVVAMLKAGAKMENGEAMAADGTSLPEATAAFFKSADAKHYVAAPANSGSGATGSTAGATKWSKPPVTGQEMREWAAEAVANPAHFNSVAQAWGRLDLQV